MNQNEFLTQLQAALKGLPEPEQREIVEEYAAHFREGMAAGRNEIELCQALGDPGTIARLFLADRAVRQAADSGSILASIRAVFTVVSLGLLNLIIVLGPLTIAILVACTGWLVVFVVGAGGVFLVVSALILLAVPGWFAFGGASSWMLAALALCFGIAALSGSGLLAVGMWQYSRWLSATIVRYLKTHLFTLSSGGSHEHP